ncbi:MAG: hypothetical protein HY258_02645 [Chloroflexi bacterium]|nr:hypothetical protein [Chloroflexota bacterium]
MQVNETNKGYFLLAIAGLAVLGGIITLSIWGSSASRGRATPTLSVDAIYTSVYQTFTAQQATQKALTPPTETPSPTLFPTLPLTTPTLPTLTFGTPTGPSGNTGCDSSVYVADVTVPDGTTMTPGQTFVKTWRVQNSGTCAWNTSYKIAFGFGEQMGGSATPVPSAVAASQQVEISVNLTAPNTPGNYTGNWKLQNDKGEFFGTYLTVVITVAGPTGTASPAVTPTDTLEPTATP